LVNQGRLLTNYHGVIHPSQQNYFAMVSGMYNTFHLDTIHEVDYPSVADKVEKIGMDWKTYQQNYPGNCSLDHNADGGLYERKHNPFISIKSIFSDPKRCAKAVNADQLQVDIKARSVPNYVFCTLID
jgi:acid phosphatase